MRFSIPFGQDFIDINIPDENHLYTALPASPSNAALKDREEIADAAFDNPIGTDRLENMVKPGMQIIVLVDDLTRPTPKRFMLKHILRRLDKAGVPDENIKLMMALGTHRVLTEEEVSSHIGKDITDRYTFLNIDYKEPDRFINLGKTKSGIPIEVDKTVYEADFKIAMGNIVPHIAAGWGGGAKMIQPGVCSEATTEITHLIACTKQKVLDVCGNPENFCRSEMEEITATVGLDFIANTVMDEKKNIHGIFCGHFIHAHREGVKLAKAIMCPKIPERADIVIASANPAQIDFWQGCKPYIFAQFGLKVGGTLIFAMRAEEGLCGNAFHHEQTLRKYCTMDYEDILLEVNAGKVEDIVGINVPLFVASLAGRIKTILVSEGIDEKDAAVLGFDYAPNMDEAVKMAFKQQGLKATVGIIPYAGETLVRE
jgi:nickel-dependent lactate racemase